MWKLMIGLALALAACGGGGSATNPQTVGTQMGLFVPLYAWPNATGDWQRVAAAASNLPVTAVINPNNAPIMPPPQVFLDNIRQLQSAGVRVLGYVPTGFAANAQAMVKAWVNAYQAYGVDGIFFDEVSNTSNQLAYYQALCGHARSLGYFTVLNPGAALPNAYLDPVKGCDAAVLFEGLESNWMTYGLPNTNAALPPSQQIALVYSGTLANLQSSLDHAKALGMGWVMVTDRNVLASIWNTLPGYWPEEVRRLSVMRLP